MSIYAPGTFTGQYEVASPTELAQADAVLCHEFAWRRQGLGNVNEALAAYTVEHYAGRRIYAAERIAKAMQKLDTSLEIAGVLIGPSSNVAATEGGTWGEILKAQELSGDTLRSVITVAQAFHAPRTKRQTEKAGIKALIPPNLPREFDPQSEQRWTHNAVLWAARELIGAPILRHRDHL